MVRYLLIGGSWRCGTTLTERVLGSCEEVLATPESRFTMDPEGLLPIYMWMKNGWSCHVCDVAVRRLKQLLKDIQIGGYGVEEIGRVSQSMPHGLRGYGASGWKTDKIVPSNAPDDLVVVAMVENESGGAHIVVRDPDGTRGGVFSVLSLTFGSSMLVDAVCSASLAR